MKVRIYGGRVGFGMEWEEEVVIDSDTTQEDIAHLAKEFSADFMEYDLEDHEDAYDYWYDWETIEEEE